MEETTPIQPEVKRIDPLGAIPFLNTQRKLKLAAFSTGILILGGLLVMSSARKAETAAVPQALPPQPTAPPSPGSNAPTGPSESAGLGTPQTPNAVQNSAPQISPQEQMRRQMLEQRMQYELKAAFASSVVSMGSQKQPAAISAMASQSPVPASPAGVTAAAAPNTRPRDELAFSTEQPLYMLPEHTQIDAVLDSNIDGEMPGPVDAIVSRNVYLPNSRTLIIPQGAKLIGETSKVSSTDQQRLAVTFHRLLVYPRRATTPYSVSLDDTTPGLDQQGTAGLRDKVNNHYFSVFGASLAVGMISGISELGSYNSTYSPSYGFYNGVSASAAASSYRVMDRFLNRRPTITIRPGTRMVIELLGDVKVPAYPER